MHIQRMQTFIANNYPESSVGMAESILRDEGFLLTTQILDPVVFWVSKPKELAIQAVCEFEDIAPDLEEISDIVYYTVPETKKLAPAIVVFYKMEKENL